MKKTRVIIMVLLSVVMVLSAVPATSYAEEKSGGCAVNSENFPDENFKNYVSSKIDTDSDGVLSEEEIEKVVTINVGGMNISSLDGIGYFVKVQEIFCHKNKLTSIDVSNNTALEKLHCYSNELQQLNVSGNIHLQSLICHTNHLTQLNLENNSELKELDCDRNEINELKVEQNIALEILSCGGNRLKHLDISNNKELRQLFCDGNQLIGLDINNNPNIAYCNCAGNQYDVEVDENNQIDLSQLPGKMDVSKTNGWTDATVDGNILTVKKGVSVVTYMYGIGKVKKGQKDEEEQVEQFVLNIQNNTEETTTEKKSETEGETTEKETKETTTKVQESSDKRDTDSNQTNVNVGEKPNIKKVSGVKIKSAKKKLTLTWKKNPRASGYQVRISTNKKFRKAKIKKVKKEKNKYVFRKLKSKKRYYVQIRAYVNYQSETGKTQTLYGKWVVKKKKTK